MDSIHTVVKTFQSMGCDAVTITGGGEPLCHANLDKIIKKFIKYDIDVGIVTNADLIDRLPDKIWDLVTWCRISCSDEFKITDKWIKPIEKLATSIGNVSWAFSYVLTRSPDVDNLMKHIEVAERVGMTHVRIVSDILDYSNIPEIDNIDSELVIRQKRDKPKRGNKDCWISLLKPVIDATGRIFPCCLDENEIVLINRNNEIFPEQIKNVNIGDIAEGYGKILNVFEREGEDILEIVLKNNRTVRVSKDHIMLVGENLNLIDKRRKIINHYDLKEVKAQDLKIGDLLPVKYGFNLETKEDIISTEEAKLIGYYLAEGWISTKKDIGFMFGKYEKDYVKRFEEICNKLDINFTLYERRTGLQYMIYNKRIFDLLSNCGRKSYLKSIPSYIFTSSYEIKSSLLESYFNGDGNLVLPSKSYNGFKMVFSTVSRKLANDLIFLLSTMNIQGTIRIERRKGKSIIEGREVNIRDLYRINVAGKYNLEKINFLNIKNTGRSPKRSLGFLKNEKEEIMFIPIKKILNIKSKKLYDIQVSNSNKFITSFGIIIHNCGVQYAEKESSRDFVDNMCMGKYEDAISI